MPAGREGGRRPNLMRRLRAVFSYLGENMPQNSAPDWLDRLLTSTAFLLFGAAYLGRFVYHVEQVRRRRRKLLSIEALFDVPIAAGMGLIGAGLGEYLALGVNATAAAAGILGYLGPRGSEAMLAAVLTWKEARKP
jgi:hypothetical protein